MSVSARDLMQRYQAMAPPPQSKLMLKAYPPHAKQRQLLSILDDSSEGIVTGHGIAGRAGGKTIVACIAMLKSCLMTNPGCAHIWTAPTYRGLTDVFLPTWQAIVPAYLYTFAKSDMRINFFNGSYIDLRSRFVDQPGKDPARGPSYAGAVLDEIREDPNREAFDSIKHALRPGVGTNPKRLWMLCITTPMPTWYEDQVQSHAHEDLVVEWSSYDNQYLNRAIVDDFARDLSQDMVDQEVMGKWVGLKGKVWEEFVDEPWPNGNIFPHEWDPELPYDLACDLGKRSAWFIIQSVYPRDAAGRRIGDEMVDVVVAEYQPDAGNTARMLGDIRRTYGTPQRVIAGSDVNTGATTDGSPHTLYFRQFFGTVPVLFPTEKNVNKLRQVYHAKNRLCSPNGQRLFCVSSKLISHDSSKKRGVLEMFRRDMWPTSGSDLLMKDKGSNTQSYEDSRDGILYYIVCVHPPRAKLIDTLPQSLSQRVAF